MILSLATLSSAVKSIAVMTLLAVSMGMLERRLGDAPLRRILTALLFSTMAILAMATPLVLNLGLIIDIRMAIAGLGAALGGPITALAVSVIAGGYRYTVVGGIGAFPGAASIVVAAICGLAWAQLFKRRQEPGVKDFAICGMMISLSIPVAIILLPPEARVVVLPVAPILAIANVVAAIILGSLLQRERGLIAHERRLAAEANLDALTGLANRRQLDSWMRALDAGPKPRCCALLLFDIDHFKRINDTWGHHVGDAVIVAFADVLRRSVRPNDLVTRLGGEEFMIVMPGVEASVAAKRAEYILSEVRGMAALPGCPEISFRVSAGVTDFPIGSKAFDAAHEEADRRLYAAKTAGRDRVVCTAAALAEVEPRTDAAHEPWLARSAG